MTKQKKNDVILNEELDGLDGLADFAGPDDSDMWTDQYPFVQWSNNEKKWEFPLKHWAGSRIESEHKLVEVDHGAEREPGFLLDMIHVAVVAWRYTWERMGNDGRMVYAAQPDFEGGQKWSKRYNFLCLIRETGDSDPCIITAKGFTGEYLYNALNQGRKRTLKIAQKLYGKRFPGYLFWIPLVAGDKRMVGNETKSAIYPPVAVASEISEADTDGLANLLSALYIGADLKELFASYLYDEGQKWVEDVPQRLALTSGEPEAKAMVLPGGVLHTPDLSEAKVTEWMKMALSLEIEGRPLFDHSSHCNNAFSKMLRQKGLDRSPDISAKWEAWRDELQRRIDERIGSEEATQTELMLHD